jgi:hypothetical protein
MPVAKWVSYPVAGLAHIALEFGAKDWVRRVDKAPGRFEVETRIAVPVPDVPGRRAELVVDADSAHHGYGLPLFVALLLASRGRQLVRRALAGYALLLIPQTFSLVFGVLKQIMANAAGGAAQLGIAQWQMEGIALGYQFGALLLPTLAPAALWLWFDRGFFAALIMEGWLRRQT